ncbi:MAG: MBL fold metallo-hydrolase [Acidobacteria bacterium]|nr:MBL fold metallo-hydrolase [Acidobacteriota bacterium]MBW4044067.1 MBL fold metallo-hydrolase [Acidobacteriota bacterium]
MRDATRRDFLRQAGAAGAALAFSGVLRGQTTGQTPAQQQTAPPPAQSPALPAAQTGPPAAPPPPNLVQQLRAAGPTTPVKVTKLRDTLFLLQGVGGNMVAQTGPDGKLLIDASVDTAAHQVKQALDSLGSQPLKLLINTHWHFDHTSGNAAMHDAGAFIIAQENTRLRLSTPQEIRFYGLSFPPAATSALPQAVFPEEEKVFFDNDELDLTHAPAAHTDSDIYIHFVNGNVIHTGDLWFNGFYPLIDDGTGGTINGMIRGVDACLELADDRTKIVPGHGALGDKAALKTYRDMLTTIANRVEKLKLAGETLQQAVAAKPTADLDPIWGKGNITPDGFVTLVYKTL